MSDLNEEKVKEALKEALKEWLDTQFMTLGRWTLGGLCSAGLFALAYFILTMNGWHK